MGGGEGRKGGKRGMRRRGPPRGGEVGGEGEEGGAAGMAAVVAKARAQGWAAGAGGGQGEGARGGGAGVLLRAARASSGLITPAPMDEELHVPLGAGERRVDTAPFLEAQRRRGGADPVQGLPPVRLVFDDPFGRLLGLELELGFDQRDDVGRAGQAGEERLEDHRQGDEGHVHDGQRRPRLEVRGVQVAGVGLLPIDDAGVGAQGGVELPVPHVHGVDLRRAALEQAVGEAAGRRPEVQGRAAAGVDLKASSAPASLRPPRDT